jgi:prophage regulatory protein
MARSKSNRMAAKSAKRRQVLRLRDLMARTGLKKSAIYAKIKEGLLPQPAHLLGTTAVWDADEIDRIIADAFAARDQATAG